MSNNSGHLWRKSTYLYMDLWIQSIINANFTFISMCRLFFEMENGYNAHNEAIINLKGAST